MAMDLLDQIGIDYDYHDIYQDAAAMQRVRELGAKTVPQIWIDEVHIGGYTELRAWHLRGNPRNGPS